MDNFEAIGTILRVPFQIFGVIFSKLLQDSGLAAYMQSQNITPIDLATAAFICLLLVEIVKSILKRWREHREVSAFEPDGENANGDPYLICPVCKRGVLVPQYDKNAAVKKVKKHIKIKHPSSPAVYVLKD